MVSLYKATPPLPELTHPSHKMNREKLVATYCRVSSLEQKKNGYGIEIQVRDVTLFTQAQGLFIGRFYRDEGESGVREKRTALKRLLRHCKNGEVGTVIIPRLDRLSRNVRISENLFWKFEQLGVRVLIADMPHYNSRDRRDVLIRQIREAIAEENRKEIIERLWKGRQQRVRQGLPPGGNTPYGFQRNGNGLETNTSEVEIVRKIFELASHGRNKSQIARVLNKSRFMRRNGKPWTHRLVSAILGRIEFYTKGVVRYGEVSGKNQGLAIVG